MFPLDANRWFVEPLLHPTGLPHADTLGIPWWVQWLLIALLIGLAGLFMFDLRMANRIPGESDETEQTGERLVATHLTAHEPPGKGNVTRRRLFIASGLGIVARSVLFGSGLILGWFALDRARVVTTFSGLIASTGTVNAARLAFLFAALFWVGAALALVSPKSATIAFVLTGCAGLFLATASRWETRLEWWGFGAAASEWDDRSMWTLAAFALAGIAALVAWREQARPPH